MAWGAAQQWSVCPAWARPRLHPQLHTHTPEVKSESGRRNCRQTSVCSRCGHFTLRRSLCSPSAYAQVLNLIREKCSLCVGQADVTFGRLISPSGKKRVAWPPWLVTDQIRVTCKEKVRVLGQMTKDRLRVITGVTWPVPLSMGGSRWAFAHEAVRHRSQRARRTGSSHVRCRHSAGPWPRVGRRESLTGCTQATQPSKP